MDRPANTIDFDNIVRTLWNSGLSLGKIAKRLGPAVSRNVVKASLKRSRKRGDAVVERKNAGGRGWQADTKERKALGIERPRGRGKKAVSRPTPITADMECRTPKVDYSLFDLSRADEHATAIVDVRDGQCRWPLGDPASKDFRFCGCKATHRGFCEEHASKAFEPAKVPVSALVKGVEFRIGRKSAGYVPRVSRILGISDDWV